MPGRMADPIRQRGAIQVDRLAGINLGLTIERQMVGIFGHQNLGDGGLGGQAALDQGLQNAVLVCAAGIFRAAGHRHRSWRSENNAYA